MSNIDSFLDNLWSGVKKASNVAGQKTTEVVELGKLKYQEQTVTRNIAKAYAKLGALVYEQRTENQDLSALIDETIDEITKLNMELDNLTESVQTAKEDIKKPVVTPDDYKSDFEVEIHEIKDDIKDDASEIVSDVKEAGQDIADEVSELAEEVKQNFGDNN